MAIVFLDSKTLKLKVNVFCSMI
uniref:Uncharacterized protein n=1 Tax=Rhizophora mucronata TaxID=61149 RepID=A0A2P2L6H7_RHIMU